MIYYSLELLIDVMKYRSFVRFSLTQEEIDNLQTAICSQKIMKWQKNNDERDENIDNTPRNVSGLIESHSGLTLPVL